MTSVTETEKQEMAAPARGHTSSARIITIKQKGVSYFGTVILSIG